MPNSVVYLYANVKRVGIRQYKPNILIVWPFN